MSQIRAKQLKLVAANDIVVGGTNGNGQILSMGSASQILRVGTDGTSLAYGNIEVGAVNLANQNLFVGNGSGVGSALSLGSASTVLRVSTDGTTVAYGNIEMGAINLASGSLLLGAAGVGSALASTTNGDVVQVLNGTFVSSALNASKVTFTSAETGVRALVSTTVAAAIGELGDNRTFSKSATTGPVPANDSTQGYAVGDVWVDTSAAAVYLAQSVTPAAAVWIRVDNNPSLDVFHYQGTLDASTDTLPVAPNAGDTYRITASGNFGGTITVVAGDYVVFDNAGHWEKISGVDVKVNGTTNEITVTGTTDTGYSVSIADTYAGQASIVTLGTVTTGVWNAAPVDQAHGGLGTMLTSMSKGDIILATASGVAGTLAIGSQYQTLSVDANSQLVYGYNSDLRDSTGNLVASAATGTLIATTATTSSDNANAYTTLGFVQSLVDNISTSFADEKFAGVAGGNQAVTITQTPKAGSVSVFINGLRLNTGDFTLAAKVITLSDSTIGYTTDASDVIEVSYAYNPTV